MSYVTVSDILIEGIAVCVPPDIVENKDLHFEEMDRLIRTTGIERKHVAAEGITAADLCVQAVDDVLKGTDTDVDDIAIILFVTQSPDFIIPSTAHMIQDRIGAGTNCIAIQVNEGCSGYVYGLYLATSLIKAHPNKKALLLVGDTVSGLCGKDDKSTLPLFGDSGTATLLSMKMGAPSISFSLGGDGSGWSDIVIPSGGNRSPANEESFFVTEKDGLKRSSMDLHLDGMNVFTFGISQIPRVVKAHLEECRVEPADLDFCIFHQANKFMNEKIRKKLKLEPEQVPYSLRDYGNTSSATIPITMVSQLKESLLSETREYLLCGFGVGVSWASAIVRIPPLKHVSIRLYE